MILMIHLFNDNLKCFTPSRGKKQSSDSLISDIEVQMRAKFLLALMDRYGIQK